MTQEHTAELVKNKPADNDSVPHQSFWQRKVITPLIGQLKQGVTPHKLAQSLTWGSLIGIFPILGTTTALCAAAAIVFRLNHIAIQLMNYFVYPLQLLLLIPFFQMGNIIFGVDSFPLTVSEITAAYQNDFIGALKETGWMALRGAVAWVLIAFPVSFIITRILTPLISRLSTRSKQTGVS